MVIIYIYSTVLETIEIEGDSLANRNFDNESFHRYILTNLNMSGSSFKNCSFANAEIKCCCFQEANLEGAKLIMADAYRANWKGAVLRNTLIRFSDFSASWLCGADLTDAKLRETDFRHVDLRGTNLDCEGLETCRFECAIYNEKTKWRSGFVPEQYGAVYQA